jgi:hypothetical protein
MSNAADRRRALFEELKGATPQERREGFRSYREAIVAEQRARPVPRWLARRAVRRSLAVLAGTPVLCGAVAALTPPESPASALFALAGAVGFLMSWLLLRRGTKLLAEAPDTALDERELEERAEAIHMAYVLQVCLLILLTFAAIADSRWVDLDWQPLVLGALLTAFALPSAVAAWRWRDLDDAEG